MKNFFRGCLIKHNHTCSTSAKGQVAQTNPSLDKNYALEKI
jgi:hypothetical protein